MSDTRAEWERLFADLCERDAARSDTPEDAERFRRAAAEHRRRTVLVEGAAIVIVLPAVLPSSSLAGASIRQE